MPNTKVTVKCLNTVTGTEWTRTFHATGAISTSTDGVTKTFTGRRDGESGDGAMTVKTSGEGFSLLDQKHENE